MPPAGPAYHFFCTLPLPRTRCGFASVRGFAFHVWLPWFRTHRRVAATTHSAPRRGFAPAVPVSRDLRHLRLAVFWDWRVLYMMLVLVVLRRFGLGSAPFVLSCTVCLFCAFLHSCLRSVTFLPHWVLVGLFGSFMVGWLGSYTHATPAHARYRALRIGLVATGRLHHRLVAVVHLFFAGSLGSPLRAASLRAHGLLRGVVWFVWVQFCTTLLRCHPPASARRACAPFPAVPSPSPPACWFFVRLVSLFFLLTLLLSACCTLVLSWLFFHRHRALPYCCLLTRLFRLSPPAICLWFAPAATFKTDATGTLCVADMRGMVRLP